MSDSVFCTVTIVSSNGRTEAEFVPGANLVCCSLRDRGAELLDRSAGLEAYARQGKTMGIPLLHPWANRLAGPSYRAAGQEVTLPAGHQPTDPNGLPIHGALPGELRWSTAPSGSADRLSATLAWREPELLALFPFPHELAVDAVVADGRLTIATTLRATGDVDVPVCFGFHPYLRAPGAPRRDWQVSLGASERLILDDRMLPTGAREPLAERRFPLGDQSWDDGLAGLDAEPRFAVAAAGTTIAVNFEEGFDWAQVYAPPAHDYICFEPMTAPANALVSGEGLRLVAPGDAYRTRWSVSVAR